jgi:nucleoside-diphosphate-sugar epimerase
MYDAVVKGTLVCGFISNISSTNIWFQDEKALLTGGAWIDVRDLAIAHRLALEKAEAGGERIIVSAGSFVWQDWREL